MAQVTDLNDFVEGLRVVLKPRGVITIEFPHLMQLMEENQFDTIYHEHFSYLSLMTVDRIFASRGLAIFDVDLLPTHGGSLRVYAQRADTGRRERRDTVARQLQREADAGVTTPAFYTGFQARAQHIASDFRAFVTDAVGQKLAASRTGLKGMPSRRTRGRERLARRCSGC